LTFSIFSVFLGTTATTGLEDDLGVSVFLAGLEDRPRLGCVGSGLAAGFLVVLRGDFETLAGAVFAATLFV